MLKRPAFSLVLAIALAACFSDAPGPIADATTEADTDADASGTSTSSTASSSTLSGTPSTESDTSGSDEETTAGACAAMSICLDAAPPDWSGPFAVVTGDGEKPPACPPVWPEHLATVHDGLVAPAPVCTCACTPPSAACSASVELHVDGGCSNLDVAQPIEGGACTQTGGATTVRVTSATAAADPPACDHAVVADIPPLAWETTASVCTSPAELEPCGEGACTPLPGPAASICIFREGVHACPDGDFSVLHELWSGAQDGRDCSTCSCGPPAGAVCGGASELELFVSADCSGAALDSVVAGQCGTAQGSARYVPQSLGECTVVQDTVAIGSASPSGPVTLCCTD